MQRYLVGRVVQAAITVLAILAIVFALARISGDPISLLAPLDATQAEIDQLKVTYGLDRNIGVQFGLFLKNALRGDFGRSFRFNDDALTLVLERIPATLQLAGCAFILSKLIAVPVGVFSAVYRDSWFDRFGKVIALIGQAVPSFWLALMAIILFSVNLGWLPTSGRGGIDHMIMPVTILSLGLMAGTMRLTRSAMLDVLDSEYIKLARAKGVPERVVIWKHALRNAAIPVVTIWGLQLGRLLSGAVVIETIFAWPGVGRLSVQAISARDYPVVQATVFITACMVVLANFIVDIVYMYIDPRIKLGRG